MQTCLGLANLLRRHFAGEDLTALGQMLLERATADPQDAASLFDAAIILQFRGARELGLRVQQEALQICRHYLVADSTPSELKLLALMAPGDLMNNIPLECLLENSGIELQLYYTSTTDFQFSPELPIHDIIFFAIGENKLNYSLLKFWLPKLNNWPKPVINLPQEIGLFARDRVAELLSNLPKILIPSTIRLNQDQFNQNIINITQNLNFPILIRPVDSHAGHNLFKINNLNEFQLYKKQLSDNQFYVSSFIDYRSSDNLFRKYRLIFIAGQPYPCHLAIAQHWMIHYLNAGMDINESKRAEEAAFLASDSADFIQRHQAALTAIHSKINLDYYGIDCAEASDGRLLIFEVDSAMIVHALDPPDLYFYKKPAMQKIFTAFKKLLKSKINLNNN